MTKRDTNPGAPVVLPTRLHPAAERTSDEEAFLILEQVWKQYVAHVKQPCLSDFTSWFIDPAERNPGGTGDGALEYWRDELGDGNPGSYESLTLASAYAIEALRIGNKEAAWRSLCRANYWIGRAVELTGKLLIPDQRRVEAGRKGGKVTQTPSREFAEVVHKWCDANLSKFRTIDGMLGLASQTDAFPGRPESTVRTHVATWAAANRRR